MSERFGENAKPVNIEHTEHPESLDRSRIMTTEALLVGFFSLLLLVSAALIFTFRNQPALLAVGVIIGAIALFGGGAAFSRLRS